jgi:cysteine-rich repeat protein
MRKFELYWANWASATIVLTMMMICAGACNSGETVAMTCPPGMAPAASQRVCVAGPCGNGVLDAEEECDDGNLIDADGCSADCQSSEVCGNAIVDYAVGELCDDGNVSSGDECCGDCRSCPELAVARGTTKIAVHIEPIAPLPLEEEEPCPSLAEVEKRPELARSRPAPLMVTPPAPAPLLEETRLEVTDDVLPPWVMHDLENARADAESAQQQVKAEMRARRRLLQNQQFLNEELLRAHDKILQIEQVNSELHQIIADDCQGLPSGRSKALY